MIYASINYMDSFVNAKNYSTPIVYYPVNEIFKLDLGTAIRLFFNLKTTKVHTDFGWILEEVFEVEAITTTPTKELFKPLNHEKMELRFGAPLRRTKVIRNYLKLQELFAKIGGLFNAVNIVCHVLLYDYILFKYRVHYSRFALSEEDFIEPKQSNPPEYSLADLITNNKKEPNLNLIKSQCEDMNKKEDQEDNDPPKIPSGDAQINKRKISPQKKQSSALNLPPQNTQGNLIINPNLKREDLNSSPKLLKESKVKEIKPNEEKSLNSNCSMVESSKNKLRSKKAELDNLNRKQEESENQEMKEKEEEENPNENKTLKNNFFNKTKTLDILKVSNRLTESSKLDSIKDIEEVSYSTYLFNRICFFCYSSGSKSQAVRILVSEKTRSRYS
eukprot:CAMPEP_0170526276 /NCGR_PEP_ID=MMETSP0209-20121228/11730_1 /TAXON_ID=665100 ORGANISM="Litonotus pictus, Strain P1" /NCGR_SAMPLE_ID=MMETSP0209 /ASSEMBLY_ACC=CAM_ASM_000301 /LENGTH=388 /DNA_ID=CAMNT_0010816025 /DNA_START=30 /DNA_END=1193 /DNA_ORIENTATION=+